MLHKNGSVSEILDRAVIFLFFEENHASGVVFRELYFKNSVF